MVDGRGATLVSCWVLFLALSVVRFATDALLLLGCDCFSFKVVDGYAVSFFFAWPAYLTCFVTTLPSLSFIDFSTVLTADLFAALLVGAAGLAFSFVISATVRFLLVAVVRRR